MIDDKLRIVACGSREDTYDSYCTALHAGKAAILLVDSEAPVSPEAQPGNSSLQADRAKWKPWLHLKQRKGDGWNKPDGASDLDCHLMVQCMEAWLVADPSTLKKYFGQSFHEKKLPNAANPLELVDKDALYRALKDATKSCQKGAYGKGKHSFDLLALTDPAKVTQASPWAQRLIETLQETR